jgi:MFS family permease
MIRALAPVAALLVSVAILLTGNGLQNTLLPIRAYLEGFSTVSIGILGSAYFLGFAGGCLLGPRLIQRAGHIRTFTAMAAIASAVPLAHALAVLPGIWWPMRAITGFCFAVLYIVIESWLNERSTNETRGTVLSVYLIINLTVITAGQMLITLYDPSTFDLFALAAILTSLAAVPVALTGAIAPVPVETVNIRITRLFRLSPVAFVGCFAVGLTNGSFWALAPVYGSRVGLDVSGIAIFMSLTVLGGALGQWPIGRLSDRLDRRAVFALSCTGAVLSGLVLVWLPTVDIALFYASGMVWGAFAFSLYTIAMAHMNDHASSGDHVEVSSGLLLLYAAGAVVGPIAASGSMGLLGESGLYAYTAAIHAAAACYAVWRMRRRAPAPVDEQVTFGEAMQSAHTVSPAFEEQASKRA